MIVSVILGFVLLGLVLLLALVLPSATSVTVPFGVRIPAGYVAHPVVAAQARLYRRRVLLCGGVIALAGMGSVAVTGQPLLLPLSVLVLVCTWYGCYFLAHQEIRAAKGRGTGSGACTRALRWIPNCEPIPRGFLGSGWHRLLSSPPARLPSAS